MASKNIFRVGVTPDFYIQARGHFELALETAFSEVENVTYEPMPDQPGNIAQAQALDEFDAVFALSLRFTPKSVEGLKRLALVARWGVGYDMIDTAALTEADVALAITPNAVRRPVAEAILTLIFALTTNVVKQDRLVRAGRWREDVHRLGRNIRGRTLASIGCGNIAREFFRDVLQPWIRTHDRT